MKKILSVILAVCLLLSLTACGGGGTKAPQNMDLEKTYEKLTQSAALPAMLELPEDLILDLCGIKRENVNQYKVVISEDSLRTDEIWLVEAKDEAGAKTIEELAQKRLKAKGEESITYSPEQYAVVEKAQLIRAGRFVALLVSPDVAALAAAFRTEAGI